MSESMTTLEAWAGMGWVAQELQHTHVCTECRELVKCHCGDSLAQWTTCMDCQEKAA